MQEGAKRRLVGAAVIVLLLVVFLPMLLEEDAQDPVPKSELAAPARPALEHGQPRTVPAPEVARLPEELSPPALYGGQEQADEEPAGPEVAEPKPEKAAPVVSKPAPAPAAEKKEPARPASPPATPENLSSWVIQVASVTDQPSAQALAEELRGKGFPAFVEQAQVKGKTYHRVRVGPEVDRKRVEAMAASIAQKTGHKGQVQRYP